MVARKAIVLLATLVILLALALLYEYYRSNINTGEASTSPPSSTIGTPSETGSTHPEVSGVGFFSDFFLSMTKFYARHRGAEYVYVEDSFCRVFLLGQVVNSTHMLNGTPYHYGVLAYKPMGEDYVFLKEVNLDGVRVTHIPPQKNITITGGAGPTVWFNVSVDGEWKVYWNSEYAGIVYYKEELVCTHDAVRVDGVTVHIVRLLYAKQGVEGGIGWASAWLAMLPVGHG